MHVEVYVEEPSAKKALEVLVPQIIGDAHTFTVHNFRNKQELLEKVPDRLKGYSHWAPEDWKFAVLVDEDREDCHALKARLVQAAADAGLLDRVLIRIVIEELEAWFFGDGAALNAAYPRLPATLSRKARYRDPDAIAGGTWEALDRELLRYGYPQGLQKTSTAAAVARHMDADKNQSDSFRVFRDGLRTLVNR